MNGGVVQVGDFVLVPGEVRLALVNGRQDLDDGDEFVAGHLAHFDAGHAHLHERKHEGRA